MCLWCMRMVSIYKDAQGNPGSDESFAIGLIEETLDAVLPGSACDSQVVSY